MRGAGGTPVNALPRPPKSDDDLLAFADNVFDYCKKNRAGFEYRLREAIFFLGGEQWIRYLPNLQRFDRHNLDEWIPTPTTNHLVAFYDYLMEVLVSGEPYPDIQPATREVEDVEAAKAARRILQSEFERLRTDQHLILPAAAWLIVSGNCVLTSGWNAHDGRVIRRPRTKVVDLPYEEDGAVCRQCGYEETATGRERCPECGGVLFSGKINPLDDMGQRMMISREEDEVDEAGRVITDDITLGDVEESVVNLLHWYPQPVSDWRKARFCVETLPMDLDEVIDKFGKVGKNVSPESITVDEWQSLFASGLAEYPSDHSNGTPSSDRALLRIVRHIPDHRFKKGKLLICTRDTVLYDGPLDSPTDALPYTLIRYRSLPGQFWGKSPIQDVLPQQKRVNAIDQTIVLNRKQMVSNQWLIPEGAGVNRVSGQAGLVIRWSPGTSGGFKPERLQGVPLPASVNAERTETLGDMRQIGGITEIMQGQLPTGASGLETGAAIEYVYESAFKRFKATISSWRLGLAEHFQRNLLLCRDHWDEERLVRVMGEDHELESYYYRGADIQRAEDMQITCTLGLKQSNVAYQRKVMDAAGKGLLGDIRDPAIRGRLLEELEIDGFDMEYVADAKKARRVLRALRDGEEAPPILPTDNHTIQFQVLRVFTLTSEFEQLDPERQQQIIQRAQQHQQMMQQEQQQAMMAAQAAKGTGDAATQAVVDSGAMGQPTQQQSVGG
jgi:hypothetical protein